MLCVALSCALLTGCAGIFHEEYVYSVPYTEQTQSSANTEGEEIRNAAHLSNVIAGMVNKASPGGKLRFSNYTGSVTEDMAAVCYEVKTQSPMGAYAVAELNYDLSRIVSYYTAEISIGYKRTAEEIEAVLTVNGVSALKKYLAESVAAHKQHEVLRVYSSAVNGDYIRRLIHGAYLESPLSCAGEPKVFVTAYPSEGVNRIYDIELDYGMDEYAFASLKAAAGEAVEAVCEPLLEEIPGIQALESALALSGRCALAEEGQASSAYDALLEGSGDSLGFALAYKALCDALDIECMAVEGSLGTLGAQTHFWNIILLEDSYYHVDISRFAADGPESSFLLDDSSAWGEYVWDTEQYPSCSGFLRYRNFAPAEPEQENPEEEVRQPELSPLPQANPPAAAPSASPSGNPEGGAEPEFEPGTGTENPGIVENSPTERPEASPSPEPPAGSQAPEPVESPGTQPEQEPGPSGEPGTEPEPTEKPEPENPAEPPLETEIPDSGGGEDTPAPFPEAETPLPAGQVPFPDEPEAGGG